MNRDTLWSGTQSLPYSHLCFSLIRATSCHPEEAMFLMLALPFLPWSPRGQTSPLSQAQLTCSFSNSLPGLQEVYNYLSSSQGRDYANCWGRQDGGDSTNITYTPTWRPVVTATPKCGSFHQSSTVSFSWRGKTHTLPSRNKRKRPGSYNVLGGCVFNGLKDFYEVLPLPRAGSEKMAS